MPVDSVGIGGFQLLLMGEVERGALLNDERFVVEV
jgi:hypothetical protein